MATPTTGEATAFLSQYLGKTLRVHTNDTRIFVGHMKCTDKDCNIILSSTYEYRPPSHSIMAAAQQQPKTEMEFSSRYVGLVVVPGEYVVKIEMEEYAG
ncbi:hypothetical protein K402DRAFT_417719 [Aulographum hederae CBS 113979]|uniref:Sm domain-containing protein n=1 Tax=Aulographum hederae CBS 113979 TaxID=1176131 RepID=A0A6G1HBD4_9PEZI|nr:hypothetical protein K402DRAFT_417719 [Aulographum hederae CBS 113979]